MSDTPTKPTIILLSGSTGRTCGEVFRAALAQFDSPDVALIHKTNVRSAVEAGMDVNGIDPAQKLTALHMAAYNGHTETVKYLIAQGATVDCRDAEGKTPLIHACTGPFAESVRVLIAAGADVNARDATEGFTPLMMAAGLGEPEVVEVLLENKADASLVDEDQETAADHARNAGHDEIVKMLK